MPAYANPPAATRYQVRGGYFPVRAKRLSLADRILVPWFLVLAWGIPYPFLLAAEADNAPGLEAALNNVVSTRGVLQILAWAGFGLLMWFRVALTGRSGFFSVLLANPPGVCWMAFIFVQMISILFSSSPLLCAFRVFQSVVLTGFLIYWFYYEGGRSGSVLIRAFVSFSATLALYNILMYVVYPDAVMSRDPIDGDRLIGGWLFNSDYSGAGLLLFTFCLASLVYCRENWQLHAFGVAVGVTEMVLSATRTVAFCAVAVACLVPWLRARNPVRRAVILAGMGIVLLSIFIYADEITELMGRSTQSLEGLDGRREIWTTYLGDFFREGRIVFGLGFLTGGRFLASRYPGTSFGNMHNMYLEALVDLGVVGLCALVASLVMLLFGATTLRRWQRPGPGSGHDQFACRDLAFCWLSLITLLILGLVSTALVSDNGSLGLTMVVAYLLVAMHFERARTS